VFFPAGERIGLAASNYRLEYGITTDFEPSLKRFRRYLEDRGIRDATITTYLGNVHRYLRFAETVNPSTDDLEQFRDHLARRKLADLQKTSITIPSGHIFYAW